MRKVLHYLPKYEGMVINQRDKACNYGLDEHETVMKEITRVLWLSPGAGVDDVKESLSEKVMFTLSKA